MTSFYDQIELNKLGFKSIGKNVSISKNAKFYTPKTISIGNNVRIDDFCILCGNIEIHSYIHIAPYSALYGGSEGIIIDDFANISSRVCIYAQSDDYSGASMTSPVIPDEYKNVNVGKIYIGRHVIIGSTSVVMPGVDLKEGSAFGAFSFIKDSTREWSINVGIPCKKISDRKKNILELEKEFMKSTEVYI